VLCVAVSISVAHDRRLRIAAILHRTDKGAGVRGSSAHPAHTRTVSSRALRSTSVMRRRRGTSRSWRMSFLFAVHPGAPGGPGGPARAALGRGDTKEVSRCPTPNSNPNFRQANLSATVALGEPHVATSPPRHMRVLTPHPNARPHRSSTPHTAPAHAIGLKAAQNPLCSRLSRHAGARL